MDIQKDHGSDIAHALDVAYVRSVHGESSEDLKQAFVVFLTNLEQFKVRKCSSYVLINERN